MGCGVADHFAHTPLTLTSVVVFNFVRQSGAESIISRIGQSALLLLFRISPPQKNTMHTTKFTYRDLSSLWPFVCLLACLFSHESRNLFRPKNRIFCRCHTMASRGFVFVSSSIVPCLHRIGTSGTTAGMRPTAKTLIYTKDATTTCVSRYETNHPRQPASYPAGVLVLVYAGCGAAMATAWRIWHIASFENDVRYIGQNLSYYKSYTYSVCVFASFNTQPYKPSSKSIKCRFVPYFRSDHGFIISHKHIHRRHFLALAVDVNAVLV